MFTTNTYVAEQLMRDRQERLRQVSQNTRLRYEPRRNRRTKHHKT
jgi:hypothetical protein